MCFCVCVGFIYERDKKKGGNLHYIILFSPCINCEGFIKG